MKNKTVLITGSSRGIGKEIAIAFSNVPTCNVVLNCNKSIDKMNSLLSELKVINKNVIGIQADVGNYIEVQKMFEEIDKIFGCVDILINNASICHIGLFGDMKIEEWQNILNTNLNSVINCSHLATKSMVQNKNGVIINISSIWGISGASCEVIYSTTKGGVNTFTKALAKELGPSNIRVNSIACGVIETEMNDWLSSEDKEMLKENIPLMRFGFCKEVAELCTFLASDKSKYMTGQIITLDGGFL